MKLPTPSPYRLSVLFAALATMIAGVGCGGRGSGAGVPPSVTPPDNISDDHRRPAFRHPTRPKCGTYRKSRQRRAARGSGVELYSHLAMRLFQSGDHQQRCLDYLHGTCFLGHRCDCDDHCYVGRRQHKEKSAQATTVISQPASNASLRGRSSFFLTSPTGNRGPSALLGSSHPAWRRNCLRRRCGHRFSRAPRLGRCRSSY